MQGGKKATIRGRRQRRQMRRFPTQLHTGKGTVQAIGRSPQPIGLHHIPPVAAVSGRHHYPSLQRLQPSSQPHPPNTCLNCCRRQPGTFRRPGQRQRPFPSPRTSYLIPIPVPPTVFLFSQPDIYQRANGKNTVYRARDTVKRTFQVER